MVGATDLADVAPESAERVVVLAPPGAIERRHVLALALRALKPGGVFDVTAPKDKGGSRLAKELAGLGASFEEAAKAHHRRCTGVRPDRLDLDAAIAEGAPRLTELGWSQPGVFSWDRFDPGSRVLAETLPALSGRGADLGCGIGVLSRYVLTSPAVAELTLVDLDRRAVECARRNVVDPRARFVQADLRAGDAGLKDLDFVVTNPPFHDAGHEDRTLGQGFVARAAAMLRKGGTLWLVANRHLPYEAPLRAAFARVTERVASGPFKVFEAIR